MSLVDIVAVEGYIQTTYMAVYPDKLLLLDSG
ncbi:MAG TPA: Zn-dependent hydrolase, partial [Psychrobacter sp.]|nr:Zn-dependent hydrolase [Psychrobacter sp.]